MKLYRAFLAITVVLGCSNSSGPVDGGGGDAASDVSTTKDSGGGDVTQTDSSSGNFTLTINDYLSWCNVSVNGADAGNTPPTYQFPPDASVALHGDTANASLFYWGYWQASNLGDGGKDTNKDVTITMNGDVTILACCPDNDAALSCP